MSIGPSLLHLAASPRGSLSNSYRAGCELAQGLCSAMPGLHTVERHLGSAPPPLPDAIFAAENSLPASERQHTVLSEQLIRELEAASFVIISSPMHNFTVPAALKAWIDQIVRPGRTFVSTPQGKQPLLPPRPVFAIVSCGGPVGHGAQEDFWTPYLRYVLATIGLTDFRPLRLERMNQGPARSDAAWQQARAWITAQVQHLDAVGTRPAGSVPPR